MKSSICMYWELAYSFVASPCSKKAEWVMEKKMIKWTKLNVF